MEPQSARPDPPADARMLELWHSSSLAELSPRLRDAMMLGARFVTIPQGHPLYAAFTQPRLLLIRSGQARIKATSPDGRSVTVRYALPGQLVGMPSLLAGTSPIGAEAITTTEALRFDSERILRLAKQEVELAFFFATELARNSLEGTLNLGGALFDPMLRRVARHVLDLSTNSAEGLVVKVDQRAIADAVGSVREVVARALKTLRADGCIGRTQAGILIIDPARLHQIASGLYEPAAASRQEE